MFHVHRESSITRVRGKFGLSQSKFAAILGISADTLQNWGQGRRTPTGPAKVLLKIAARHPEVLLEDVSVGDARVEMDYGEQNEQFYPEALNLAGIA